MPCALYVPPDIALERYPNAAAVLVVAKMSVPRTLMVPATERTPARGRVDTRHLAGVPEPELQQYRGPVIREGRERPVPIDRGLLQMRVGQQCGRVPHGFRQKAMQGSGVHFRRARIACDREYREESHLP